MHRILMLAGLGLSLALGTTVTAATSPEIGGLPPWHFQMTPEEVKALADYGPYKSFSNGDLETYAGVFNGHKENVQFFFKDGKLVRLGIFLYEGQDIKAAAGVWGQTYEVLREKFGAIELPDIHVESVGTELAPSVVAAAAGANVDAVGKSQMAPFKQPSDIFVFASFRRENVQGKMFYYVTVNYDPPRT
jgi:hypothetical protein